MNGAIIQSIVGICFVLRSRGVTGKRSRGLRIVNGGAVENSTLETPADAKPQAIGLD